MSEPRPGDLVAVRQCEHYLCGTPRQAYHCGRQSAVGLDVHADTDWAGCAAARRSTSGGRAIRGQQLIKDVGKHSEGGHAQFRRGVVGRGGQGASEGLGLQSVALDFWVGLGDASSHGLSGHPGHV